jgi:acyl-CoA synthetase (AMP-forming)/AMP-acid ligase II
MRENSDYGGAADREVRLMELHVAHVLHRNYQRRPDQHCLVDQSGTTTHAEVLSHVSALAGGLRASGVTAGDRVAVVAANSARYVEALFAIMWAGAIACPVNIRWSPREVLGLLHGVEASAVFVDEACPVPASGLRADVPSIRCVVDMSGRPDVAGAVSYEQMLSHSGAIADSGRRGDDIALLLSTGGTTGRAKQAALSHGNVLSASLAQLAAGSGTGEVFVHVAPLFHLAGTQMMLTHMLGGSGPQVFLPRFSPDEFMAAVEEHRATDTLLVPTMLRMILVACRGALRGRPAARPDPFGRSCASGHRRLDPRQQRRRAPDRCDRRDRRPRTFGDAGLLQRPGRHQRGDPRRVALHR